MLKVTTVVILSLYSHNNEWIVDLLMFVRVLSGKETQRCSSFLSIKHLYLPTIKHTGLNYFMNILCIYLMLTFVCHCQHRVEVRLLFHYEVCCILVCVSCWMCKILLLLQGIPSDISWTSNIHYSTIEVFGTWCSTLWFCVVVFLKFAYNCFIMRR